MPTANPQTIKRRAAQIAPGNYRYCNRIYWVEQVNRFWLRRTSGRFIRGGVVYTTTQTGKHSEFDLFTFATSAQRLKTHAPRPGPNRPGGTRPIHRPGPAAQNSPQGPSEGSDGAQRGTTPTANRRGGGSLV